MNNETEIICETPNNLNVAINKEALSFDNVLNPNNNN
jgi:hypothetical protein